MADVQEQTKHLLEQLDQLKDRYESNDPPENKRDKAFFLYVKETTVPLYEELEEWEKAVLATVKNREVNLHPQQVTSTKENMELLLMHSYYIDVSRKRYMAIYKSVHYVFDQLLQDIA